MEGKPTLVLKLFSQIVQGKGLEPACILMCSRTCERRLKSLPHLPHLKLRSSRWADMCLDNVSLLMKDLSHSVHL
ncbi:hypothetical protein DPMN_026869 [Dreissena polymorpha]|uniref:Uncharacterized protein n=1 Tax=Dreissena polymorpha TaxID=45954 RepID=A0A9D4RF06_DREPO|nr:hypothetical protein DPMN_026869 [Dreissena polymorpha]